MVSLIKQDKAFRTAVLSQIIFLSVFPFGYIARCPMLWLFDTVLDLYNYINDKGAITRFLSLLSRNNKKNLCVCVYATLLVTIFLKILITYDNGSAATIIVIRWRECCKSLQEIVEESIGEYDIK